MPAQSLVYTTRGHRLLPQAPCQSSLVNAVNGRFGINWVSWASDSKKNEGKEKKRKESRKNSAHAGALGWPPVAPMVKEFGVQTTATKT